MKLFRDKTGNVIVPTFETFVELKEYGGDVSVRDTEERHNERNGIQPSKPPKTTATPMPKEVLSKLMDGLESKFGAFADIEYNNNIVTVTLLIPDKDENTKITALAEILFSGTVAGSTTYGKYYFYGTVGDDSLTIPKAEFLYGISAHDPETFISSIEQFFSESDDIADKWYAELMEDQAYAAAQEKDKMNGYR